jgi:hypothetical protein
VLHIHACYVQQFTDSTVIIYVEDSFMYFHTCHNERQLGIIFNYVDIVFNDNDAFSISLNSYICEFTSSASVPPDLLYNNKSLQHRY